MKKLKYIIAFALTLGIFNCDVYAQDSAQKKDYSFERIEQISPWLTANNGAGLVFNKAQENFSNVYGYYNNENGKLRNYNDPKSIDNFGLATKSYGHQGKFYFYGLFNYDYSIKRDQTWLGTVYQGGSLAPIVEDVPGKVIKEDYILATKLAYKVSPKFAFGLSFNYNDATANKKRDGRNGNRYSNFIVSPGITFNTAHFNFGLALNYGYNAEDVNYEYIGDAAGKHIYYMEGLFIYTDRTITGSGIVLDRRYEKNSYGGSLQAELVFGPFSFFNNFSANYFKTNNYEEKTVDKRYSYVDALEYKYNGVLKASCNKFEESLLLGFRSSENLLYNISNIYEEVEGENGLWQYYEHGSTMRYRDWTKEYDIALNGMCKRNEMLPNFEYTLGFRFNDIEKIDKIYPSEYSQHIYTREYYASLGKSFMTSDNGYLLIGLNGSFRNGSGTPLFAKDPIQAGTIQMQQDLLATDYAYNTSNRYNLGISLKYNYYVNKAKGMSCWFKGSYNYTKLSDWSDYKAGANDAATTLLGNATLLYDGDNRNFIGLSLGFNF